MLVAFAAPAVFFDVACTHWPIATITRQRRHLFARRAMQLKLLVAIRHAAMVPACREAHNVQRAVFNGASCSIACRTPLCRRQGNRCPSLGRRRCRRCERTLGRRERERWVAFQNPHRLRPSQIRKSCAVRPMLASRVGRLRSSLRFGRAPQSLRSAQSRSMGILKATHAQKKHISSFADSPNLTVVLLVL